MIIQPTYTTGNTTSS